MWLPILAVAVAVAVAMAVAVAVAVALDSMAAWSMHNERCMYPCPRLQVSFAVCSEQPPHKLLGASSLLLFATTVLSVAAGTSAGTTVCDHQTS